MNELGCMLLGFVVGWVCKWGLWDSGIILCCVEALKESMGIDEI